MDEDDEGWPMDLADFNLRRAGDSLGSLYPR